jgi:putative heme iron utilization protein
VVYLIDYSKLYFKKLDKLQKEQPDNLASRLALQYEPPEYDILVIKQQCEVKGFKGQLFETIIKYEVS